MHHGVLCVQDSNRSGDKSEDKGLEASYDEQTKALIAGLLCCDVISKLPSCDFKIHVDVCVSTVGLLIFRLK